MTTERKRDASRRNGRRSRGPISENGKARASQNARTHGLCSRATLVLANEDAEAFEVFAASMRAALQPVGGAEELLVDRIVAAQWRLTRVQRVELGLFEGEGYAAMFAAANEKLEGVANNEHEIDARVRRTLAKLPDIPWWRRVKNPRGLTEAVIAVADLEERKARGPAELARAFGAQLLAFGLLSRYEAPLRRELTSALHDLERQQRRRREEAIPVASAVPGQNAPGVGAAETHRADPAPNAPRQGGEDADTVDRVATTDPSRDPQFRRAVERRIRAKTPGLPLPAAEHRGNSPDDASAPMAVANFPILRDALAPIIGNLWPVDAHSLGRSLADVGRQVEDEGIYTPKEGRQPAVRPPVRRSAAFPDGAVDVIDVPQYIAPDLIHALPDPDLWPCLGGVVERRTVGRTDRPAPGHCWYVVQHVPGVGPRLRLWDRTYWPDAEKWTDTVTAAFVSWWNDGVAARWGRLSQLNEADVDGTPRLLFQMPAEVVGRLTPTPALEAWVAGLVASCLAGLFTSWLAGLFASSVEQPPEVLSTTEPLDDETNPSRANRMASETTEVIHEGASEEPKVLPKDGTPGLQADDNGDNPHGADPIASDREESTAENAPRPEATAPHATSYTAAALVDAMRRQEIQSTDALQALRQGAPSYSMDDLAGIMIAAALFPEVKQEAMRLLAARDEQGP